MFDRSKQESKQSERKFKLVIEPTTRLSALRSASTVLEKATRTETTTQKT
jgi:hypothetical protein